MPVAEAISQDMQDLIREEINEILSGRAAFTFEHQDRLDTVEAQVRGMLQDRSFGRIMDGPLWLSGTSVVDGSIAADKLTVNTLEAVTASTGTLNVTGTLTAAASYPALSGERITLTSSELAGFNSSDAKTFSLDVDGSGFIGIGSSKLSWTTAGVVTVPAAAIGSLTIADVGSGTFNSNFDAGTGRVRAGTALQRVELTSAGLHAYNTSGTETFELDATNGSLSMIGTFSMKNSASGARVEVSNVGVRGFNSAGTLTFQIASSDGSGQLGATAGTPLTWNSSGTVVVNGSLLVANTVTAGKLNVSTLSAISANMGTITAGSITAGSISVATLDTGTITFQSGGTLSSGASYGGTLGSMSLGSLTVSGSITIGSGGKIVDADGSEWSQSGIILKSGGSFGDVIKWQNGGSDKGSIYATSSAFEFAHNSGQLFGLAPSGTVSPTTDAVIIDQQGVNLWSFSTRDVWIRTSGGSNTHRFDDSGRFVAAANIFPGNQVNDYLGHNGTDIGFGGLSTAGTAGSLEGYFQLSVNGTSKKIAYYALS